MFKKTVLTLWEIIEVGVKKSPKKTKRNNKFKFQNLRLITVNSPLQNPLLKKSGTDVFSLFP